MLGNLPGFWDGSFAALGVAQTMSLWEYKVITSGKGGFATPALLEKFLNDLGREEWEIVQFQPHPDNFLAFTGMARRSTQRDWTLQDAAAAAAKAEAEKLRAEFEAKFKAANQPAPAEERAPSFLEEKTAPDDGFRKPVDTSRDDDPEVAEEEKDEWDKLTAEEDELPTFFDAIKPHMRRNQRGPGMSVGVDYLAKKWDQAEEDLKGALVECGFVLPIDEDSKPEHIEYDGDLYWLNINRRGELWINTKEKPRPAFRAVKAQRIVIEEDPARAASQAPANTNAESGDRKPETAESGTPEAEGAQSAIRNPKPEIPAAPLPAGADLLAKIRPHMRRNRRGPGGSGSASFLSRALRTNEAELRTAFAALGLAIPAAAADKPVYSEFGNELWWLNLDSRGGLWINGREKKGGETAAAAAASDAAAPAGTETAVAPAPEGQAAAPESVAPAAASEAGAEAAPAAAPVAAETPPAPAEPATVEPAAASAAPAVPAGDSVFAAVRLLLKDTRTGAFAGKAERLAEELGKPVDDLVAALVAAGLKVPEKAREKPVVAEFAGEIFWFNRNGRGDLWLNAKPAKFADKVGEEDEADDEEEDGAEGADAEGDKKPARRGGRGRGKKAE
ncbi:MAG: hypothetical protein B9S34_11430 [Opitutia bacterium Tous-C1TDCM]|nr:MAG: hypothetical protein B9S34_11430 [Opitutae bacterium Tous-C1TDCM]